MRIIEILERFLPTTLIAIQLGAAVVYAINKKYVVAGYWFSAAAVNIFVMLK